MSNLPWLESYFIVFFMMLVLTSNFFFFKEMNYSPLKKIKTLNTKKWKW